MTFRKSRLSIAAAGFAAFAFMTGAAGAAGLEQFAARAEQSAAAVDYAPLDEYLDVFGVPSGKRLKFKFAAAQDVGTKFLREYVDKLAATSPATLSGDDQLAFWLNLRNALVLAHLSESGGRASMKKDRGVASAPGAAWTAKSVTVDGVALSIDDIERGVILANWQDPRVLYGLYQGSAGGPPAERKAFQGATVWADLDAAAKRYLTSPGGFELTKKAAEISAIYDWYGANFFADDAALRAHLSSYITHGARINLEKAPSIAYKDFNYRTENHVERIVDQTTAGQPPRRPQPQSYPTGS
ncbi:MAG: DUF547 domain-containing protein [Parvularculaceae bacterium]|nr:DUF547 domain-containing protein [Parvularculaceae bacterium]